MPLHEPTRRTVLTSAAALCSLAPTLLASSGLGAQVRSGDEIVPLWPNAIPGDRHEAITASIEERSRDAHHPDRWVRGVAHPVLVVKRPVRSNGAAVLVMPGGGYGFLSYDNEGLEQAAWLNARGITAFVLQYRLPGEGWDNRQLVPLQDAQRAMRLIRAGARRYGVDIAQIAVLGFSAGGHLAGSLATRHAEQSYAPVDAIDTQSARPDYAGLIYPVVSMEAPFSHGGSRDALLGNAASAALRHAASVEARVTADTPPVFLAHAADDDLVPVANSVVLFTALKAQARPTELHVFDSGGHGFGVRLPKSRPASSWPDLFLAFGASRGVFHG
ncbi:alpha/beta hydrolase [Sphingomonas sp. CARO-RG-8B-R24-01]|uniref:alpha/beta hydrolase n=1 Tax=Sphingomonas sp. CARO-RG-8B-R24-01 TaxID=2914831 RepID=UPI001F566800|nr:alpha/beta hydrolase [Sphingomonas sp. CARO-RG-8B-R24-01]